MPTHSSIELLEPGFQVTVRRMISLMEADPRLQAAGVVKISPRETLRDLEVQMAYYSRYLYELLGKPTDAKIKTALIRFVKEMFGAAAVGWLPTDDQCLSKSTETLESKHLKGLAIDIAPSKDGKTAWWAAPDEVWNVMGEIGKQCGLRWGGDFPWPDRPHFEKV